MAIGCRGNIGRNLMRDLSKRIVDGSLCGIDICLDGVPSGPCIDRKTAVYLNSIVSGLVRTDPPGPMTISFGFTLIVPL